MSCTLLLLGMYVADCAVCRSHTHTGGIGGCMCMCMCMCIYLIDMFQVSHKAIQPNKHGLFVLVVLVLCLSVCLFVVGFSVVVCTLLYTLSVGRGNLGGFRRGVREGVK